MPYARVGFQQGKPNAEVPHSEQREVRRSMPGIRAINHGLTGEDDNVAFSHTLWEYNFALRRPPVFEGGHADPGAKNVGHMRLAGKPALDGNLRQWRLGSLE